MDRRIKLDNFISFGVLITRLSSVIKWIKSYLFEKEENVQIKFNKIQSLTLFTLSCQPVIFKFKSSADFLSKISENSPDMFWLWLGSCCWVNNKLLVMY